MLQGSTFYNVMQTKRFRIFATFALIITLFTLLLNTVFAAGELGLGLTAVDTNGNPISSVQSGDIIEYIIDYSCADLTDGCGELTITFDLDLTLVELVEVITSPSYRSDYTAPRVTITNNPDAVTNPFEGGESAQARVRVRVVDGLTGNETIPSSVTGQVDNGVDDPATTTVTSSVPDIPVDPPTEQWSIVKSQVSPSGVAPAPGGLATYSLAFCPDSTIGNISITNPVLVDTFPANAVVVDAGGGSVSGNTITWTPPTLDDPLRPSDGCETVTYTLQYPAGDFPVGTAYTNTGSGDGDNTEIGATGICDDGCTNNTVSGTIAAPTADFSGAVSKGGPGSTVIVAPGDSSGTSVFTLGLDLSSANVATNPGVTLTDILPTALSDGLPATSVTNISSGTWDNAPDGSPINAILEITTTGNPAWTQLPGALNGSTPVSWSSAGGDFIGPGNGGAGNDTTDLVTGVRLTFQSPLPAGFSFNSAPSIRFIVRENMAPTDYDVAGNPVSYTNCVDAAGTFNDENGTPQNTNGQGCTSFLTSADPTGFANITTSKSSDVNSIFPLEEIQFTLTVNLTEEASGDLINPAIEDILPAGLEFLSFTATTPSAGAGDTINQPYLVVNNVGGQDELLFYWDSAAPVPGSVDAGGGTPTNPNPLTLVPPATGNRTITIVVTARALLSAAAGPYTNTYSIASESPNMRCQGVGEGDDLNDIDGDGLTNGDALCEASDGYSVREAAEMGSQKWIRSIDGVDEGGTLTFDFFRFNNLDTPSTACPVFNYNSATSAGEVPFTRFPCVAEGLPTENFEYLMRATNTGIVDIDEYVLYDVIPYIGDTGVSELIENQTRDTEFLVFLTGPIVVESVTTDSDPGFTARTFAPATFTIEYNQSVNACRGEVANPPTTDSAYPAGCDNNWQAAGVFAWNTVRAFRIRQNTDGGIIPSGGGELIFTAPMQINEYNPVAPSNPEDGAQTGEIAWNSFAQQFSNALSGTELLAAEPPKVGITVAQRYSVGNRVWIDNGGTTGTANDGIINGDEVGINGVTVQLWRDTGGGFTLYATDVTRTNTATGEDGYYFFGNLDGGPNINYQVRIPGTEFDPANGTSDLDNYVSSTGQQNAANNNNADSRDTGIDPTLTIALDEYISNGVSSNTFTLTSNSEATGETDVNADGNTPDGSPPTNEGPLGYGENQEEDEDSDLTVDFGFYKPMSLGNRVWLDDGNDGAGGTNILQRNDGIINGGEVGIENVVLRLYASDGTTTIDNPFIGGTQPYEVTTDADGYYLFQGLVPGNYVVRVMPQNFQFGATPADPDGPLADYISSNSVLTPGTPAETPVDENAIEYGISANDAEDDRTDHGIDPATDGDQRVNGIYSAVIPLTADGETASELPADKNADGDGLRVSEDNSDLTVDFGFFQEADTNFSIGNFVWDDRNNDGIYDPDGLDNTAGNADDELPIANVQMALFTVDAGGNPSTPIEDPSSPGNPYIVTTDGDGYYVFSNLNPGRYIVQITAANFNGGVLSEYISSTGNAGDTETDSNVDENGIDPTDANSSNSVTDEYQANGVFSVPILLEPEGEPTGEPSNLLNPGPGSGGADDDNSDLTVDFGVYRPMSIGNIVWRDNGSTATGININQYNDGIRNGNEPGINGVTVQLYGDFDGDGAEDVTPRTTTTDTNGYYLFDGLTPGDYRVEIPTSNFTGTPLQNLTSSFDAIAPVDADLDDDDHGIDVADPTVSAVVSPTITLTYDSEPLETDAVAAGGDPDSSNNPLDGPNFRGNNGETDDNSDRTVDFGFVAPPMSLGNLVFIDDGGNGTNPVQFDDGIFNIGTEVGINGVTVNLYAASDTTTVIASDITDNGGYYLFDNLPPGDYVVGIPASNFSGVLAEYVSSTDFATPVDADPDFDDHGINPAIVGNEVFSPTITLATNGENQADDEAITGLGANGETDVNSDLTVDFGFIRPMSLGNRVWLDTDRTVGTIGDGTRQANETGIANVIVELYLDNGTVGVLDGSDTLIARTTTTNTGNPAQDGYYLFDETTTVTPGGADDPLNSPIGPGNYLVHIPASNFAPSAPLEGLINSDGANGSGIDNGIDSEAPTGDENGVDAVPTNITTYPVNAGVTTTQIQLRYDVEPPSVNEPDRDPNRVTDVDGVNVSDDNSDLTIDFGFYSALSIGNRVWFDNNRDGLIDGADDNPNATGTSPGIDGVTVYLYRDANADGIPDGPFIATDVTANGGYYLFDQTGDQSINNGGSLLTPGNYIVGIDPTAGNNPTVLANHISTITRVGGTGNDAPVDNDDNGIDRRDIDPDPIIIYSESIALASFTETETEVDKEVGIGDGRYGIRNNSSNLTVDFGFYIPLSIGNRVWLDDGAGGGGANNALLDGAEDGIDGVIVELFRDTGGGIDPATDTPYRTTTTNADTTTGLMGYYLFDDLPEGNYIVRLSPRNFIPDDGNPANGVEGVLLTGIGPYSSSETDNPPESGYLLDNQTDNNDNGIDENFPPTNGIVSNVINLSYNVEPDGATDADLDSDVGEGTFGELDFNAEMTVDFGVYTPSMSIGNRVFYDYDNNRILDGADVGVTNVIVNLFRDTDQNGVPDSGINSPIATDTTDANGYYIFDGLQPGYYLVQIDENNFRPATSGVLQNYFSSQDKDGANNPVVPVDNEDDTIEDGIDNSNLGNNPDPRATGVFSPTILLEPSGEPIGEDLGPEGNGEPNIQASNSDLSIDFGFYQPMSIGNVVWFDTNADGLFNNGEAGIAGVEVYLYRETVDTTFNSNETLVPVYNGSGYVNFDTTDANGFYLFDNLPAGQYWVQIDSGNFTASGDPLFSHISTQPENVANTAIAPAPSSDSNDNGTPNDATATTDGVTSELITLGVLDPVNSSGLYIPDRGEPFNEINKSNNPPNPASTYDGPASIGRYGELDTNSDITIDFGFVLQNNASMSIGNRVWLDEDRSGLIESNNTFSNDEASAGIDGVLVLLYRANAAGNPVGAPIARDITANGGYYLFDVLDTDAATGTGDGDGLGGGITPGSYVVAIAPSNFTAGNVLAGYTSTTTAVDNTGVAPPSTGVEAGYPAGQDDNNDNGTANATYGVISNLVTLTLTGERDDEDNANKEVGVLDGTDAGGNPITPNNSDLTVDFGFYVPTSIGNRVWIDSNNNGVFDTGENPVPDGVTLTLYRDTDNSTDYTPGVDTPVDNPNNPGNPYQVTTTNGYYLFENLFPFDDYIVVIDPANFAGGVLNGFTGSDNGGTFEDDTDTDLNDNGRDAASYDPAVDGIPSGIIEIILGGEPQNEQGSGNPADGPNSRGNNGETDLNSNLTVDFGVFPSTYYSIGNRVWVDTGAGANTNNGIHDADEAGIPAVIVNLYRDDNDGAGGGPDGIPDSLTTVDTTTTNANGYYLFEGLAEGNYIVSIAPQNFNTGGALIGYSVTAQADASDGTPNDDEDNVSDHQSAVIDANYGIYSNTYNLSGTTEPTGETDPTPAGTAQDPGVDPFGNPIPDNQSNLTIDFGFLQTMSLGNVVWFDLNNDGLKNNGETGIAGVEIVLYLDDGATTPGVFDPAEDTQIAIDVTDGNGYYLFNDLLPDDYFINIPETNWTAGTQPLAGMQSSDTDAPAGDRVDSNDNGTPNTVAPTDGVTSALITMTRNGAPTGETDLSNNPDDGPSFRGTSNPSNNNSDLTRDFGFFLTTPMSIGNRVWIDDGGTTGTANNGVLDGDEEGIGNVVVQLYSDTNGDGLPDTTTPIESTTTDGDGYYLFDGLPPGQYVVVLAQSNWTGGLLDGYLSTTDGTPDNDSEDNGVDNANPSNGGIRSGTIVLEVGTEPTADDEAVTGTGSNGETDEDSNLTVDFGLIVSYDWGDAPDSYGTTNGANGANHRIVADLYLGGTVDDEGDGQPVTAGDDNNSPNGDGTDEDGLTPPVFVSGTTIDIDVTVFNDTGQPATLVGWFDWDGNGTFDAGEAATANVPDGTDGVIQLTVTVPDTAEDDTGGNTYARLRLTNDALSTGEPTGAKDSGEVEDYYIEVLDVGLLISKTDARNSIVAGTFNTYTIIVENSGADRTGVRFLDEIPVPSPTDATGYDPDTITWTCEATGGASCIATQPAGTGSSGGPFTAGATSAVIDELIDLPTGGRVVYTIRGRMNEQAGLVPVGGSGPVINTAQLPNELPPLEDSDETEVIFDPPFGVKTGTVIGGNIIRWTMIWYNPGAQQSGITIGDDIVSPQQLPATAAEIDLQCSGGGAGGANTGTCSIIGNRIEWNGTMDTSTIANDTAAVRIAFNVTVPGPGTYNNVAILDSPSFPRVSTTGRVAINEENEQVDAPPPIELLDPTIVKLVTPALALPGEDILWTIVVRNPNDANQLDNVSVTDNMPGEFEIISTNTNSGTVTTNGQEINWQIGTLAPQQEVALVVTTRLRSDAVITNPLVINTAVLMTEARASAEVNIVTELPDTGEIPWWRTLLIGIGAVICVFVSLTAIVHARYILRQR